ncbi:MAG: exodeoxyribonuclease VII small subunit [Bacteroidetes bacterium]|jgi:exodeoxyribonuclease VII small subunit|nr:MAG: exodeoxyribonuclease VII small subunit [Bacteroidota bacterium]PTM20749.1 MAG: exodeoxyribonuclease VII small subunit [Bacteroidota bacterium]
MSEKKERISFEDALRELEDVVEKLSREDVSLEDSVRLYEEGLKLSGICSDILEKATQKITELNP